MFLSARHRVILFLILALTGCQSSRRQPAAPARPLSRPGANPVISDRTAADPHLAVFGNRFYLYPSTYGPDRKDDGTFVVFTSDDLVHWQAGPTVLTLGTDVPWAKGRDWAPAIAERDGQYFFYFSADDRIGVAVGDSPTGPFRDALGKPLVAYQPDLSSIDPMVFIDDDQQAYLYWGAVAGSWRRAESDTIHTGLFVRRLNADLLTFSGPAQATVSTSLSGPHIEGSFVFKRRGLYYLLYSAGNWDAVDPAHAYRVEYATARSPLGPWTKASGNPILSTNRASGMIGPGHNSVVQLPGRDEWYMAYHYHQGDADRRVAIDRLYFNADGSIRPVAPTRTGVKAVRIR